MKPDETRIKVVTLSDGTEQFIAQHKCWFFWYDFGDFEGINTFKSVHPYNCCQFLIYRKIEGAQKEIDNYLKHFKDAQQKEEMQKSKKVRYVKYP